MTDATYREPAAGLPSVQPADRLRRRFLLAFGAGAAGAAASATAPALAAQVAPVDSVAPPASQGYRETDHVRDYYASTRL